MVTMARMPTARPGSAGLNTKRGSAIPSGPSFPMPRDCSLFAVLPAPDSPDPQPLVSREIGNVRQLTRRSVLSSMDPSLVPALLCCRCGIADPAGLPLQDAVACAAYQKCPALVLPI